MPAKKPVLAKTRRAAPKVAARPVKVVKKIAQKPAAKADLKQQITDTIEQVRENSRKNLLAGLGAFARMSDQRSQRFAELVEEGRRVQPKVRKAVQDMLGKLQPKTEMKFDLSRFKVETPKFDRGAIQRRLERGVTQSYHLVGLPTRKEVEALARKVNKLAEMRRA